ncbi:MAG: sulfite exporter TauE/SafE family protein [Micropepsaceae bacterium]
MSEPDLLLTGLIFLAATLYSSVGHAGASGYLAAMALFGLPPDVMRPTALALNILVAALAVVRYTRAGQNDWRLLAPFAIASVPAAFLGGIIHVPPEIYRPLVGAILAISAVQFARTAQAAVAADRKTSPPPPALALASGAGLGLLSGLTGTGGGIFLSPLLLFMHWAETRKTSGVAASFILVNSIAGLLGTFFSGPSFSVAALPSALPIWAGAAFLGGLLGTQLGTRLLPIPGLRLALAAVLVVASGKMLLA